MEAISAWWPVLSTIAGVIIAWLISDAGFKAKMASLEEKVITNRTSIETNSIDVNTKLSYITIQNARSEQDRAELHHQVDKLEVTKANKEAVESFKAEVARLSSEMDKRFDRLDRLMEYKILKVEKPEDV